MHMWTSRHRQVRQTANCLAREQVWMRALSLPSTLSMQPSSGCVTLVKPLCQASALELQHVYQSTHKRKAALDREAVQSMETSRIMFLRSRASGRHLAAR